MPTPFAAIVATVAQVTATSSRSAKVALLAQLLAGLEPAEVDPAIGLLTANPRQGPLGVGWMAVSGVQAPAAASASLTIAAVDAVMDQLAAQGGPQSGMAREARLADLWSRATESEQELLGAVLLGQLRMGALAGMLTDAVARAADRPVEQVRRAVMLGGSLGTVAAYLLAGGDPTQVGLTVGVPVAPMLAGTAREVAEAVQSIGPASVEVKLDGARIQVHRLGGPGSQVRVYTRSLADITERVPEIVAAVAEFDSGALILDGETLSLDEDGGPRPFQDTMSRFGTHAAGEQLLRPWFFDLLHEDGTDLIDEPLSRRRERLARVVGDRLIPSVITDDPVAAEAFSRQALADGHEGAVVKALSAPYAAGRRGKHWLKVKPVLTYDLVVLAAEWGSGRRTGWLSNLHLGAANADGVLTMVGKTFKGLTDELLRWQTERFLELETGRSGHVVHVRPELVVEIAIDGVQRSRRYAGGLALRFARVKRYRPDKGPADADSLDTLRALLPGQRT